jgi:hypothetical protein
MLQLHPAGSLKLRCLRGISPTTWRTTFTYKQNEEFSLVPSAFGDLVDGFNVLHIYLQSFDAGSLHHKPSYIHNLNLDTHSYTVKPV